MLAPHSMAADESGGDKFRGITEDLGEIIDETGLINVAREIIKDSQDQDYMGNLKYFLMH
jgi:hypothetical protein